MLRRVLILILLAASGCLDSGTDVREVPVDPVVDDDDSSTPIGGPVTVLMRGLSFAPEQIEITAGTSVTWVNDDIAIHVVGAGTPETPLDTFWSPVLHVGDSWTWTFDEPGEYLYFCATHPTMMRDALIVVN